MRVDSWSLGGYFLQRPRDTTQLHIESQLAGVDLGRLPVTDFQVPH